METKVSGIAVSLQSAVKLMGDGQARTKEQLLATVPGFTTEMLSFILLKGMVSQDCSLHDGDSSPRYTLKSEWIAKSKLIPSTR